MTKEKEIDFDWFGPDALGAQFFDRLAAIREHKPVFWSEQQNAWIVTRYADVEAGFRDRRLLNKRMEFALAKAYPGDAWAEFPNFMENVSSWIVNIDGADHMRVRKLIIKPFSPTSVQAYRALAQRTFERTMNSVQGEDPVDLLNDVIMKYPSDVLVDIVGIGGSVDGEMIREWSRIIGTALSRPTQAFLAAAEVATLEMKAILHDEIQKRRENPDGVDLLANLVAASEDAGKLSEHDIVALFQIMLIGGFDTTGHTLALSLLALDKYPEQRQFMAEHRDLMPQMMEELSRYSSIIPAATRLASEDFEWHGEQIRKGDMVYLSSSAANHDPHVFDNPDVLDLTIKRSKGHLSFAPGIHHCIGHSLSKMQQDVAHNYLLDHFERVEILTHPVTFHRVMSTRTPKEIMARFHPRQAPIQAAA